MQQCYTGLFARDIPSFLLSHLFLPLITYPSTHSFIHRPRTMLFFSEQVSRIALLPGTVRAFRVNSRCGQEGLAVTGMGRVASSSSSHQLLIRGTWSSMGLAPCPHPGCFDSMEASGGEDLASAPVGTRLMTASQIGCFRMPDCNKIELSRVLPN